MHNQKNKHIFITISRGFLVRNILRSGVLQGLLDQGCTVTVFLDNVRNAEDPKELVNEFKNMGVTVVTINSSTLLVGWRAKGHSLLNKISTKLIFSDSTKTFIEFGNDRKLKRNRIWYYIDYALYSVCSRLPFLKHLVRIAEQTFFTPNALDHYFDTYQPEVVFCPSIVSKLDIAFMKVAKKRCIRTVAMPKGWDNVTKHLYRVVPDTLVVQNEHMLRDAQSYQLMKEKDIVVTGFPQFDFYTDTSLLWDRETYCKKLGVDPGRKILFFGSEGIWAKHDVDIAEKLVDYIHSDRCAEPCSLIIRPHFTDMLTKRFDHLAKIPHVVVDYTYSINTFFLDNWAPSEDETQFFANTMHHLDVMIMTASTLALDAACTDKPIIGIAYDVLIDPRTGEDISPKLYHQDHYRYVLETGALDMVTSQHELEEAIDRNLEHPEAKKQLRQELIKKLCYKQDGHSAKRVVEAIITGK